MRCVLYMWHTVHGRIGNQVENQTTRNKHSLGFLRKNGYIGKEASKCQAMKEIRKKRKE